VEKVVLVGALSGLGDQGFHQRGVRGWLGRGPELGRLGLVRVGSGPALTTGAPVWLRRATGVGRVVFLTDAGAHRGLAPAAARQSREQSQRQEAVSTHTRPVP
jgi:hypothetical protein